MKIMDKRFYYEVGLDCDNLVGHLMANTHKDAVDLIVKHLNDLGITQDDIEYLNVDHVDNDDIMGIQYDELRIMKRVMNDMLMELNISPVDLKNNTTHLKSSTSIKIIEILDL